MGAKDYDRHNVTRRRETNDTNQPTENRSAYQRALDDEDREIDAARHDERTSVAARRKSTT